jgi:hypothetical protein
MDIDPPPLFTLAPFGGPLNKFQRNRRAGSGSFAALVA